MAVHEPPSWVSRPELYHYVAKSWEDDSVLCNGVLVHWWQTWGNITPGRVNTHAFSTPWCTYYIFCWFNDMSCCVIVFTVPNSHNLEIMSMEMYRASTGTESNGSFNGENLLSFDSPFQNKAVPICLCQSSKVTVCSSGISVKLNGYSGSEESFTTSPPANPSPRWKPLWEWYQKVPA